MARVTIEDCLEKVDNRFALVHLGAKRVRQLNKGAPVLLDERVKNKEIVVALREIAAGKIGVLQPRKALPEETVLTLPEETVLTLPEETVLTLPEIETP